MFKSIKWKIFSGFLVMAFMLLTSGAFSIYQFVILSRTFKALENKNYETMRSASSMLESLENEDAGILLHLSGNDELGDNMVTKADSSFRAALGNAAQIYNPGHDDLIKAVGTSYNQFRARIPETGPDSSFEKKMQRYVAEIHPSFSQVKTLVKTLISQNRGSINEENAGLKEKLKRAIVPGAISIMAALIFSILFTYFINKFFIDPILVLTRKVEHYTFSDSPFDEEIISYKELKRLDAAIEEFFNRYKIKR